MKSFPGTQRSALKVVALGSFLLAALFGVELQLTAGEIRWSTMATVDAAEDATAEAAVEAVETAATEAAAEVADAASEVVGEATEAASEAATETAAETAEATKDVAKKSGRAKPERKSRRRVRERAPRERGSSRTARAPRDGGSDKKLSKKEKEAGLKYRHGLKARRRQALSATCIKKFEGYQDAVALEPPDYKAAESALRSGFQRGCKEGFEHSELNRALGFVLYSQERFKDAVDVYLASINEPEADPQKRTNTRYTAAQLMYMLEDYPGTIQQMELWMDEVEVVDKGGKVLLARSYHSTGRKDEALKLVEEVMAEAAEAEQIPRESWLAFQWVLYYEREDFKKAVGVNRTMLTHYPKIKYWKQLSAMYGSLEESMKETIALDLTYQQDGLDKDKQYIALAYQFMALDAPYKGAQIIDKAIKDGKVEPTEKHLEILGSAYQRAQEYDMAAPVLEEAAKKSSSGNAYSRLASVYLNLNENEKALKAARNALQKGNLKREDLAWMNRGSAEAALHCYRDAERSFTRATRFEKTKKGATNWIAYVKQSGERRRKLIASGAKLAGCKKV